MLENVKTKRNKHTHGDNTRVQCIGTCGEIGASSSGSLLHPAYYRIPFAQCVTTLLRVKSRKKFLRLRRGPIFLRLAGAAFLLNFRNERVTSTLYRSHGPPSSYGPPHRKSSGNLFVPSDPRVMLRITDGWARLRAHLSTLRVPRRI